MARHAAALERAEQAELALWRCGARETLALLATEELARDEVPEIMLAGAMAADVNDRVTRYRRAHEKAFHAALVRLREAKETGQREAAPPGVAGAKEVPRFQDEAQCEGYLLVRFAPEQRPCPRCGAKASWWLPGRRRWECRQCRHQWGVRNGTVMAGSRLRLSIWFAAIRRMVLDPASSIAELMAATGIAREATARRLAQEISAAQRSANRTELLAGLDLLFGTAGSNLK
jgi:transposase-like protein